jgi:hypothetical protein
VTHHEPTFVARSTRSLEVCVGLPIDPLGRLPVGYLAHFADRRPSCHGVRLTRVTANHRPVSAMHCRRPGALAKSALSVGQMLSRIAPTQVAFGAV